MVPFRFWLVTLVFDSRVGNQHVHQEKCQECHQGGRDKEAEFNQEAEIEDAHFAQNAFEFCG